MLTYSLLFKQVCNIVIVVLLFLHGSLALVLRASFYTDFRVDSPANLTLSNILSEVQLLVADLCAAVPALPCAAVRNITLRQPQSARPP